MALESGDKFDRYTLLEKLGQGGQGVVWKVDDPLEEHAPKVVKILRADRADPTNVERARREARALAKLSHRSLVRCHALVEDMKQGYLGVVLDWVDGQSLREVIDDKRLDETAREAILVHVADALGYLHDQDIVHRDIKLPNIVIANDFWNTPEDPANVKLVDFGIAAQIGNPEPLTEIGTYIGTLAYTPPEVIAGSYFEADAVAPHTDVFAFGVLAWYLLSGSHPAGEDHRSAESLVRLYRRAADGDIPWPLGNVDHRWRPTLVRCLKLEASARPATLRMIHDLLSPLPADREATQLMETKRSATGGSDPAPAAKATAAHGQPKVEPKVESPAEPKAEPQAEPDAEQEATAKPDAAPARPRKLLPQNATEPADPKDLKDAHRRPGYQGWLTSPRETLEADAKRKVRTTTAVVITCLVATALVVAILVLMR